MGGREGRQGGARGGGDAAAARCRGEVERDHVLGVRGRGKDPQGEGSPTSEERRAAEDRLPRRVGGQKPSPFLLCFTVFYLVMRGRSSC